MIYERDLWRGRRCDNNEIIEGHLLRTVSCFGTVTECVIVTDFEYLGTEIAINKGACVDPYTLEPVAVKVDFSEFAPRCINCGRQAIEDPQPNYCPDCGQRLDWRM